MCIGTNIPIKQFGSVGFSQANVVAMLGGSASQQPTVNVRGLFVGSGFVLISDCVMATPDTRCCHEVVLLCTVLISVS